MIFTKMLETLLFYTRYVGVKGKSFQGRGIGGEGGQYMGNLFKANKVKLIIFLMLVWQREAFQISGRVGVNYATIYTLNVFFFKIFFKSWGACPSDPP